MEKPRNRESHFFRALRLVEGARLVRLNNASFKGPHLSSSEALGVRVRVSAPLTTIVLGQLV